MTQENKELLIKDLSARLSYGVMCHYNCVIRYDTMEIKKANCVGKLEGIIPVNDHIGFMVGGDRVNALFDDIKPYLRLMSSMTEEERNEYNKYLFHGVSIGSILNTATAYELIDWLNVHHFDYRELIEKGLAIEVTAENNPYEK